MIKLLTAMQLLLLSAWRPAPDAEPEEVKRLGWKLAQLGLALLAVGIIAIVGVAMVTPRISAMSPWLASKLTIVHMLLIFPGLCALIVGGYRGIMGAEPDADDSSSATRLAVGVCVGCGGLLLVAIALLAVFALVSSLR